MSGLSSKEEGRRKESRYSRLVRALPSFAARNLAIQFSVAPRSSPTAGITIPVNQCGPGLYTFVDMGVFTWLLQPQPVVFTRG
jgi:hypothetical protein